MKHTVHALLDAFRHGLARWYGAFCNRFPRLADFMGFMRRRPLKGLSVVAVHLLGFVLSIQAVMQSRTEQGAVAWLFALNTLPIVAAPAWLVFGNSKVEAHQLARRAGMDSVRPLAQKLAGDLSRASFLPADSVMPHAALQRLRSFGPLPPVSGNTARVLIDGESTYRAILDAISGAEHYILVQFFIFREDGIGKRMRDALVAKAEQGVAVYLLLDGMGSIGLSAPFVESMERKGIRLAYFTGFPGKTNRFQLNFRNHRKIVVVDGKRGFLGGLNVGDEYLGQDERLTPWRDTHVEWRGPIVKCLQIPFAEDWIWAAGQLPEGLDWEIRAEDRVGDVEALCLASGPTDPFETCAMGFLTLIDAAQQRLWLATPYFVPDDKIVTALQLAALRGVDVRVLLPDLSDNRLIHLASFAYFKELERAGVRFFRYQNGFLHQKVLIVDDSLTAIGSANLDNRSFRLNYEVLGIVSDRSFNGEVARMLEADLARSQPTGSQVLVERSFWFRLGIRFSRMLSPIL